ncbi:hypothetical protein BJV82DRAFT_598099 [Fennellomyces sp. T-0311]|nr:hypothetical protein BJV82DRAFT_598099 [Fennellomyces sp. T-0311]
MTHREVSINQDEQTPLLSTSRQQSYVTTKLEAMGLIVITVSCLAKSSAAVFVKFNGDVFPLAQIVFARALVQATLGMAGCIWKGVHPLGTPGVRKMVLFRCLVGAVSMVLFYYSLLHLPLADTTVIMNLQAISAAILAAIVLKEPFGWFERLCLAVSVVGTVFVAKPGFLFKTDDGNQIGDDIGSNETQVTAVLSAVGCAVLAAIAYVTVRKVGSRAHFFSHTTTYAVISMILGGVYFHDFIQPANAKQYFVLGMTGVCAFFGQCLINLGLQMAPTGPGTLMCTNEVVFAFLYGILIFHEYPDYLSIIGAITIMSTTIGLGLKKWKS